MYVNCKVLICKTISIQKKTRRYRKLYLIAMLTILVQNILFLSYFFLILRFSDIQFGKTDRPTHKHL